VAGGLAGFHRALNRETAGHWDSFAPHRERVTQLIMEARGDAPGGTLAVLGAGNGNDLALDRLAARFAEVHLFDIDREALDRARGRQLAAVADRLVLHGPVDLGGAQAHVEKFRRRPANRDELGALPAAGTRDALARGVDRFDLVASTCVLSQIVHGCEQVLGAEHPQLQEIACATVIAHLRVVAQLARPGGVALLVTDTVSSDTYPLEELWGQREPWALIDELEETGNHLSGTSPRFLRRLLSGDPVIAPLILAPALLDPWLWQVGPDETYLVYGLRFDRRI
jgi:hypothetical protein